MEDLIGMPLELARKNLEDKGFRVKVIKCSKPKIKTDSELITNVRLDNGEATLFVGDFLIEVK